MENIAALSNTWNYPTTIHFGNNRSSELPFVAKSLGIKKPLLVTDPLLKNLPMIKLALDTNKKQNLPTELFTKMKSNPISQNVMDGVNTYKLGHHDGIIAWGGGSAMDTAKAIALMVSQTRPIWDFEDVGDNWRRASTENIAPIIAVPTTSGTGSEVGRASVITDESTHTKKIIFHPQMLPSVVICDPKLVVSLPANVTAWTGMDALAHCFEAYCSPIYHPMADGIAIEGMRLCKEWLPLAFEDGSNILARGHMMSAAAMGATAFQKGLGAIHSLSHPIGAIYDTHHGMTNATVMPYVIIHNKKVISDKMEHLSKYLNLKNKSVTGVLDWILDIREQFKIPHTIADLNVDESYLNKMATMASIDPTACTNPIPVGPKEMLKLYQCAMTGVL